MHQIFTLCITRCMSNCHKEKLAPTEPLCTLTPGSCPSPPFCLFSAVSMGSAILKPLIHFFFQLPTTGRCISPYLQFTKSSYFPS